jgi:UDP-glucose 4-epimerase
MRILVTGGAGYVGSIVSEELLRQGHEVVIYDNLYRGHLKAAVEGAPFVQADLSDERTLGGALATYKIEAVIHMAGYSSASESMANPSAYYRNNLAAGLSLLKTMNDCGVKQIVFASSSAVYGEPKQLPIKEEDQATPNTPLGETKLAFERALGWFERAHGFRYVSLRHFNTAGASQRHGESHEPETHLIPVILEVAAGKRSYVDIYGHDYPTRDGTCVRDYVHVIDLARAHVLALDALGERSGIYNVGGGGSGFTVREVIELAREVTGGDIPARLTARRGGDPAALIACNDKIKRELNWQPAAQGLRDAIASSWLWMQEHPSGYEEYGVWTRMARLL